MRVRNKHFLDEQRALRESREIQARQLAELENIYQYSPVGMAMYDDQLRFVRINEKLAEINGLPVADHSGRTLEDVIPMLAPTLRPLLQKVLCTGEPVVDYEITGETSAQPGVERSWLCNYHPVRSKSGDVLGVSACIVEITERKQLEEEVRRTHKLRALGQLAAGVAHDFNNVLMGIQGCADLVERRLPPDSHVQPLLRDMRKTAQNGAAIAQQLLRFGCKSVDQEGSTSLDAAVADSQQVIARLLGEDTRVVLDLNAGGAYVGLLRGEIEQILFNLATNARDAMPQGGQLEIVTGVVQSDDRRAVRLVVTDTGVGMPAAVQERVFEPFFTTKVTGEGTGLGLSSVYGIMQRVGGSVRVRSKVGAGTRFELYFPMVAPIPDSAPVEPARALRDRLVLVVEDDRLVRMAIKMWLEQAGFRVLESADGTSALRLIRDTKEPIDLLLTDTILPGMNGGELARFARERWPALSVIVMSAHSEDWLVATNKLAERCGVLQKPFDEKTLVSRVTAELYPGS